MQRITAVLATLVLSLLSGVSSFAADVDLTFFGWSDQHVKTDGTAVPNAYASVAAMNRLPGTAYPPAIGGTVAKPAFVFGAGDFTEWPTAAAVQTYKKLESQLSVPTYDILGNHDDGGEVPSPAGSDFIVARRGALSYTFEEGGVHFIAVHSAFDPKSTPDQPITNEALDFIRKSIAKVPKGEPIVVATHLCFSAIKNPDALVDSFGDANVVLVLSGHYHQPSANQYRNINFVQLPSPASDTTAVTVVHITTDRVIALPYNYSSNEWMTGPVVLDARLGQKAAAGKPEPVGAGK